jgi:hypothetical protein
MSVYLVYAIYVDGADVINVCETKELALVKLEAARARAEEIGDYGINFSWEEFEVEES